MSDRPKLDAMQQGWNALYRIYETSDEKWVCVVALTDGHFRIREIEVVSASVENRPGGLAALARKLADAGLNVEAAIPTGMSGSTATIAIATNDPARARSLVGTPETVRAGMG